MPLATDRRRSFSIVPWLFVAGFALVIAVNGTMMWFAIGSFSGLYSDHARDRGVHYNQVIAEQRARDAIGWRVETIWQAETHRFGLAVKDASGRPLDGAAVSVELIRPAEKRAPVRIAMEPLGGGRFAATVALPARGNWDADIVVDAGSHRFAITKRLFLQ